MKRSVLFLGLFGIVVLLATGLFAMVSYGSPEAPEYDWFWGPVISVREVFSGRYDDHIVVMEGQITTEIDQWWKIYNFVDSTGTISVNFQDSVPAEAIIRNTTVRVIGEADNGEVKVQGLQTLMGFAAQPSATVAQINSGNLDEQDVSVKGKLGNLTDQWWRVYDFSDGTGTVDADLQNEWADNQYPVNRTLMLYGQVDYDNGWRKIDVDLVLLAAFDSPPPTPTPTATAGPPPTKVPTPPPGPTPTPAPGNFKTYLPAVKKFSKAAALPTPTSKPPSEWVWGPPVTQVSQILGGSYDEGVVVVEGRITGLIYEPWMEYNFNDGSGQIKLDFEDEIPTNVIPLNSTVRIIGKVKENNGQRKIDVFGMQTLGTSPATSNATAAQVKSGSLNDQEVSVKGQIGDLIFDEWMLYEYSDGTGTTVVDLENDMTRSQVPQGRTLMIYGKVDGPSAWSWTEPKINVRLILVAAGYGN